MNAPDKKISRLMATMNIAGDDKAAKLLGLLVANGAVDLDMRFDFKLAKLDETRNASVAEAIGRGVVEGGDTRNLMELAGDLGEEVLCRFFDWKVDGEHIATAKLKQMAQGDGQNNTTPSVIGKSKTAPTAGLDTWIGLLCRHRNPLDILDEQALIICMGARMPETHGAIANALPGNLILPGGTRLWSHARSQQQFFLLTTDTRAMQDMDLLMELSASCEAKRARGRPTEFASALDSEILQRLLTQGLDKTSRPWINQRVGDLVQGKNAKWLGNDTVMMWTKAWMSANQGQPLTENLRSMLLDRRNADANSLLIHYGNIMEDKPLFQAVGIEAIGQRLLELSYQRFRSKGNTGTLKALVQSIGWPQEGAPHLLRIGLCPSGADKSNKKDCLDGIAALLNKSGAEVWGENPTHTAGLLLGRMRDIIVQGGDGQPGSTSVGCLTTLNSVLSNGEGDHAGALRFCGALSTYMVVQQSAQADRCLQTMMETAADAEHAIEVAGGKPLHEVLDDIAVTLKNSKKREPFQSFKSMAQMRARTATVEQGGQRPRF